jgi:nucleoside 2-deoxyribosyltransferase
MNNPMEEIKKRVGTAGQVYLSGPIHNNPRGQQRLNEVAASMTEAGVSVFNPMENDQKHTREEHMRIDIRVLCECTHMVTLPGWEAAAGCVLEFNVAIQCGIPVTHLESSTA